MIKLDRMTDYVKQLESKVKDCKNTNTIFDTRKYVLLEDAKEILNQALTIHSVSHQRELLIDFCSKAEDKAGEYKFLIPNPDFVDEYLKGHL